MNDNGKQQLTLMNTMNEVVEFIKKTDAAEEYVYDRLKDALLSFGLCGNNRMIELLGNLKKNRSQLDEFIVLFEKWFDTNIIALSNRIKTSESYETGLLGCDRKFIELISIIKNHACPVNC